MSSQIKTNKLKHQDYQFTNKYNALYRSSTTTLDALEKECLRQHQQELFGTYMHDGEISKTFA